jgi:hypothetical protein
MSISLLRRLLMKEAVKDTAGSSGIMSINKNIAAKVEQQVQRYVNDAMRQGVDLDTLSPEQLKMIVQMNKPKPPRVIAGDSPEGKGIMEALLGKRGEVVDMAGKKLDTSQGIMGGKSVKELMDSGQVSKGARGMKKSKKVQDREMFQGANKRLKTEAQLKAEMEASNKKAVKNLGNKRQLTEDEYQDFLDEVGGADQLEAYDFDGTVGSANKIKKQQADYMAEMQMEFRKGKLDPEPGSRTPQRKRFLQSKLDEAEASGDARLLSREEREELFDLDDIEDFAGGGRAGFKGGGLTPEDYLKVKDMLNHWHDYKKGGGTLSKTKFANAFFRENNADGGVAGLLGERPGYAIGNMVDQEDLGLGNLAEEDEYDFSDIEGQTAFVGLPEIFALGTKVIGPMLKGGSASAILKNAAKEKLKQEIGKKIYKGIQKKINKPKYGTKGPTTTTRPGRGGKDGDIGGNKNVGGGNTATNALGQTASQATKAGTGTSQGYSQHFAKGGITRQNFAMGKRAFLKMLAGAGAGIAGLKSGLIGFGGKGAAKKAVTETVKSAGSGTPPPYFFNLVNKIKTMGDDVTEKAATKDREVVTRYKDFELTEDVATGEKTIQRIKTDTDAMYYDETLAEDVYMNYKPGKGQADETTKGIPADEYVEDTSYLRTSGPQKGDIYDTVDGVPDDVIKEGTMFEDNMTEFGKTKKASGGIARMLGE